MAKNSVLKKILSLFSISLVAQIVSLAVSVVMILYTPRHVGVENYGYWQLYLMLASFVGFFHLGFNDGIYLRQGGKTYEELDRSSIKTQMSIVFAFEYLIGFGMLLYGILSKSDANKSFVWIGVAIYLMLVLPYSLFSYILQACGRVQWYSYSVIFERAVFLIALVVGIRCGLDRFQYLIALDLGSRFLSFAFLLIVCRKIVFAKFAAFRPAMREVFANIGVGIKLMLSNIASSLIIAVGRIMIERAWGIETFGKISLSISLATYLIVFLTALSIVLFPILRTLDRENARKIYHIARTVFMILIAIAMLAYVPMRWVLEKLLPQYADGLQYLAILFPMCLFEARLQLVSVTYLKVYRKENGMLLLNVISLAISAALCSITVFALKSLNWTVIAILVAIAVRSVLFDWYAERVVGVRYTVNGIAEIVLGIVFSATAWYIGGWKSALIYAAVLAGYLCWNIPNVKKVVRNLKELRS